MFNRKRYLLNRNDFEMQRYDVWLNDYRVKLEKVYCYELEIEGETIIHHSLQTPFCNKDSTVNSLFKFHKKGHDYE